MPYKKWKQKPDVPIQMSTPQTLQVLYEDNHLVVVNKRSSDIIQNDKSGDTTLCEVVRQYVKIKYNKPGEAFIGTVHRLDRPVSGVVVYARTTKALSRMTAMFKHREVQKTYWAVCKDMPAEPSGTVVNYLEKNSNKNRSVSYSQPGDGRKEAQLSYQVVGKGDNYNFIEVYPKTGRHHQIRVTMSSLKCPIKGDIKYGAQRTNKNASIHLHARKIEFIHPVKKELLSVVAPPPEDDSLWKEFLEVDGKRELTAGK